MAVKALIFGVDDLFPQLKSFYDMAFQRGDIDIVGYAALEQDGIKLYSAKGGGIDPRNFDIAIISSGHDFYNRMKMLERSGVPRNRIIDGRVFKIPHLDFLRLLNEGMAYGILDTPFVSGGMWIIHPRHYKIKNSSSTVTLGTKSYIAGANVMVDSSVTVGNFSAISWNINFLMKYNVDHNYKNVGIYGLSHFDWNVPEEFYPNSGDCNITIGSDVWIGRNCIFNSNNPEKPLVIGDGSVIASDSVVVKSVPPYAIVGGNPAQIIKYRFSDKIIEALLRIKWWDWDIDKIHDNFQYFNRVEEFVEMNS